MVNKNFTNTSETAKETRERQEGKDGKSAQGLRRPSETKYRRVTTTSIPEDVLKTFEEYGWNLRLIRFELGGRLDLRNLAKRQKNEGYEFVTAEELESVGLGYYTEYFEQQVLKGRGEGLTIGDVVLMKNPLAIKEQRRQEHVARSRREIEAVDTYVLNKKGFITDGSKSSVTYSEPSFKD